MQRTKRVVIGAVTMGLAAALAVPAGTASAAPRATGVSSSSVTVGIASDADWILQGQLPDGAIAWYVDRQFVSPYQANFAAMGLAAATKVTGDRTYSDAAWRWLDWYAGHADPATGYVTDYTVTWNDGVPTETSTGDMDSTDAYAGTFLLAADATYRATWEWSRLSQLHGAIETAVGVIESTQDADGLTWAKPTWHVKYLMDQAEAYAGLQAAAGLARQLGDWRLAQRAAGDAARMQAGVEALWNPATGAYDWAVHDDGARQAADWSTLYPDAMEQAWAAAFGLASPRHASSILTTLDAAQPAWDFPAASGYWPVAGWAYENAGGRSGMVRAAVAAQNISDAAELSGRAWPFTTGVAGQLIVLQAGLR